MFIAIPVGMNYRTERLPVVTFTLIGINTLVWLVSLIFSFTNEDSSDWIFSHLWLVPAACTWYAPLTSMFVHAGIFHLLGNMIFLFLFGSCVEDIIGRLRFAIFYILSGLLAVFVYIAMTPDHFHSDTPMGGASGAISGCMGMYLLLRADADIEFRYFFWFFVIKAGEFELPAWVAITFWFVKDLFWAVLGMFSDHHGGGVAFGAHVGGLLGGLGLVAAYRWFLRTREQEEEAEPSGQLLNPAAILAATRTARATAPVASETAAIFIHTGGQQLGPYTLTQVQSMLAQGQISYDDSYWSEGMSDWASVRDLAG